jgi:hypothetical protein
MPASLDSKRVEDNINKGRRTFLFELAFFAGEPPRKSTTVVQSTDGATTVPGSLLRLRPAELLVVKFKTSERSIPAAGPPVKIQLACHEWQLLDGKFFISGESEAVLSPNRVEYSR